MPWREYWAGAGLPFTDEVARTALAIPLFNRISESQQDEVAQALHAALLEETASGT